MEEKELFQQFLQSNEVLIIDKNPSSRKRLGSIVEGIGIKKEAIHSTASHSEAEALIGTRKIGIVMSDYFISGGSGFDLFKTVREKFPERKDLCLILVTSNMSQNLVAQAAEEDVDSFILKPYSEESIQKTLQETVLSKLAPSEYLLKIDEGKNLINLAKYQEAIYTLNMAIALHPRPALAIFYKGQAEHLSNNLQQAKGAFSTGLSYNEIHFKCSVGLYKVLMEQGKKAEAYQVMRKLAKNFPANQGRLAETVRLAIKTENYEDMQSLHEIFSSLEEKGEELINYIGAGMYIAGKYQVLNGEMDPALQYFDNVVASCPQFTKFTRAIVVLLIEKERPELAKKYLNTFPDSVRNQEDYAVSNFLVNANKPLDKAAVIKEGMELFKRNIRDYVSLQVLVKLMSEAGRTEEELSPYKEALKLLSPEKNANLTPP